MLAMETIKGWGGSKYILRSSGKPRLIRSAPSYRRYKYNWKNDYPINLQRKSSSGSSSVIVEFEFNEHELNTFKSEIGSNINGTLPIEFRYPSEAAVTATIAKPGRGHKSLNAKVDRIIEFVAARIETQYIPAVRTASSAKDVVSALVESALGEVEVSEIYQQALDDIAKLQQPVLDQLSESITETMKLFMPNIKLAKVSIREHERALALRNIAEISLDDGVETSLEHKGDGVQSLAALALMRHASQTAQSGKDVLIALEEPESHLHPHAIRQFRDVLLDLASRHQVVVSTHNPIFVNRVNVRQNIIVHKSRAYSADTVADVRDVLGVRLDDNLTSAEVVLIVEGEDDRIALRSLLSDRDGDLREALNTGRLTIDIMGGAGNLNHRIRVHSEAFCSVHVLLDDDTSGRKAQKNALEEGLLTADAVNLTVVGGKLEAELEDLYNPSIYEDIVLTETGLPLIAKAPDANKKWADRVRTLLKRAGRPSDDASLMVIKLRVAQNAAKAGWSALVPGKTPPLESLAGTLRRRLGL